ncbi:hypothetical protein [Kribbella sp. CA-294648]|uniref:hypothetical protein n=1 Tax=Kribbella sp. CA-294648 TaxID=3239948 RepID=UPI003D8A3311
MVIPAIRLHDRAEIEKILRRDAALHAYELGDLDDFYWSEHDLVFGPFTTLGNAGLWRPHSGVVRRPVRNRDHDRLVRSFRSEPMGLQLKLPPE